MSDKRIRILNAVFVFTASFIVNPQWALADTPIGPAELLKTYQLSETVVSPDGRSIAVVVTEPVEGDQKRSSIWVYERETDVFRKLTTAGKKDRSPRWSPDGRTLGFLSEREDEKPQIFLLPVSGGEGERLTNGDVGIGRFEWSPDGSTIAYLATDEEKETEEQGEANLDDARVVSEDYKATRLWSVDVISKEVREVLTEGNWTVSEFAWLLDSQQLVLAANNIHNPEILADELYVVDWNSGKMRGLGIPARPLQDVQVSPDGKTIAYVGVSDGGPVPHDVYLQSVAGGTTRNLTSAIIDRPISKFAWLGNDSLMLLADDGFGSALYRVDTEGTVTKRQKFEDRVLLDIAVEEDLQTSVRSSAVLPPELWVTDEKGERQVSNLHPDFPILISPEIFRYTSHDDTMIEAALFLPSEPRDSLLPLITLVHGGPTGRWMNRINNWAQLLVSQGYAVFTPNIRGSTAYGLSFLRSNRRDWGGADYGDVMAGIDSLIERGIADPNRLGIGGWSYGGYMSAWAVTQTHRFKAAVIGAPMTDLAVEYGTETALINAYDTWFLGTPYENLDDFIRMSPMTYVKNARTPSLILVGEDDAIDPIAQCWQFYRGLKRYDVDAEMVIYPREPHGIQEELHKLDVLERMTDWFDRHLELKGQLP